ncbi:putative carboxyl-terminal proteinase, partial [Thalictrum thalictroides]
EPPERPNGHNSQGAVYESFQLWRTTGESCPEGTIPIRRIKEVDLLRASSVQKFGRKLKKPVRHDSSSNDHEVRFKERTDSTN